MKRKIRKNMFSLVELLTVIVVILILTGILFPVISHIRNKGKETKCMSDMRQIGAGILVYRVDFLNKMPPWISTLYPKYVKIKEVYHCPKDGNNKNTPANAWLSHREGTFTEAYDRPGSTGVHGMNPNPDITKISYFYEFTDALCSLESPAYRTWAEYKNQEMKSYSLSLFPMLRCTWHYKQSIDAPYFNIAYAGNFFLSKADWQNGVWEP